MATLTRRSPAVNGRRAQSRTALTEPVPRLHLFDYFAGPQHCVIVDFPPGTDPEAVTRAALADTFARAVVELCRLTGGHLQEATASLFAPRRRADGGWVWARVAECPIADALDRLPTVD